MTIITTHNIKLKRVTDKYKIELIPLCDDYLPYLYKWYANPEVLYWTETGEDIERSYDKDTVHQIYEYVSPNAICFLILVEGIPVGDCWLQKMNLDFVLEMYPKATDVRRIDMAIGEKDYWGNGIGSEFISMLAEFAFKNENVDVLHCMCGDYNPRSMKVWEKNGFKPVFKKKEPDYFKGKYECHYRLTKDEYFNTH
jgi:RimJ/RimL family protein N-acetyltransferase